MDKLEKTLLKTGQISQAEVDALHIAASEFQIPFKNKQVSPRKRTYSQLSGVKSPTFKGAFEFGKEIDKPANKKQKTSETAPNPEVAPKSKLAMILSKLQVVKDANQQQQRLAEEREKENLKKSNGIVLFKSSSLSDLKEITSRLHPLSQQAYLRHHHHHLQYTRQLQPAQRQSQQKAVAAVPKTTQRKKKSSSRVSLPGTGLLVGDEVAALVKGTIGYGVSPDESLWILGKVANLNSATTGSRFITVADADNAEVTYKVHEGKVVPLIPNEEAIAAKARLPKINELVLAMYPDSTTFYKATLRKSPHINSVTQDLVCLVKFFDDEDETGVIRDKAIPVRYVFYRSGLV